MTLAQYQIKPSGYDVSQGRFSLFSMPPTGHRILTLPCVESLIRVRITNPNLDKPPGQPSIYSATTSGVALCVADWMEYLGFVRGSGYFQNKNTAGNIFLQHFGTSESSNSLMHNIADALASSNYNTEHLYCGSGIASNKVWATGFAHYLRQEITNRGLCEPYSMDMDFEDGARIQYAIVTDGVNASGNWSGIQNDPRYGTEPVFQRYDPRTNSILPITMSGAYVDYLSNGFSPPNPTGLWFQPVNYNFSTWYFSMCYRANSYALYKSLIEPMREKFPNIGYGNYENVVPLVSGFGYPDEANTWLKPWITGRHDTQFTYQMPNFYAPSMEASRYVTGVLYGATTSDVYRNFAINRIIALTTGNNNLTIRGHLPIPGQYTFYSGTAGNTYVHTAADQLLVMQSGYAYGIKDWQIFFDEGYSTNAYIDTLYTLIQDYLAWYGNQQSLQRNHVGSITRGGSASFYVP